MSEEFLPVVCLENSLQSSDYSWESFKIISFIASRHQSNVFPGLKSLIKLSYPKGRRETFNMLKKAEEARIH